MQYLSPMVSFLVGRTVGITVSGPRNDLPINPAPLDPTCIIQQVPGAPDLGSQVRVVSYTIRIYAMSDDAVLAAFDALDEAFYDTLGDPITGLNVDGIWMYSAALGTFGGPVIDPVAKWPVLTVSAQVDWAARQLEVM